MEQILKEINAVFTILSSFLVSEDGVEKMAAAKAKLRWVYAELEKLNTKEETENGG